MPTAVDSHERNPRNLSSLTEILSCLSALQSEEAELSNSLAELLTAKEPIASSLTRLQHLGPDLDALCDDVSLLSERVSHTAQTATRIGEKVQSLDREMSRIREAGERVAQVMELKSSLAALQSAIEAQDWETATRHCARAMALPSEIVSGAFAGIAVPTSESHLPPSQTLEQAREHLLAVFRRNFEQASRSHDSTATSRFFKLFPAIGYENEGLDAYAAFVSDLVRVRAPTTAKTSSPLYYITCLTALFENIAMIVDQHQPVVEKYYGDGKMRTVVVHLMEECDRLVRGILDGWEEERSMNRKLVDTLSTFPSSIPSNPRQVNSATGQDTIVDPRDIDKVLSEIAGMVGRWSLLKKFLAEALQPDLQSSGAKDIPQVDLNLEETQSHELFNNLISKYYVPLETWYLRTIIEKAHRLSSPDITQSPIVTTTPDDVFYILKLVTSRIITTGSMLAVSKTLEQLKDVVDKDYIGTYKRKIDEVYRNPATSNSGPRADRENRTNFIILLNDLDVSSSHLDRLSRDLSQDAQTSSHFPDAQRQTAQTHISNFSSLKSKFRATVKSGLEQLFTQLIKPKLRAFISEIYKEVTYVLDEDAYSASEYQDVVRKRFIKSWESLLDGYKEPFTDQNYNLFFEMALDVILRPWEKFILSFKYSELGAIRFDRDLRAITSYLTAQTTFGDTRGKFARLQQISTILNLDAEEDVDEFYSSSGITWKISAVEARTVATLKV